jgi:hypothetical protein
MPGIAMTLKLLFHGRHVDHVLRRQLAGSRHERGSDGDWRSLHRGLLDHVTALAPQRPTNTAPHDAQAVGRVDDGVDRQRPELCLGYVNLHLGFP